MSACTSRCQNYPANIKILFFDLIKKFQSTRPYPRAPISFEPPPGMKYGLRPFLEVFLQPQSFGIHIKATRRNSSCLKILLNKTLPVSHNLDLDRALSSQVRRDNQGQACTLQQPSPDMIRLNCPCVTTISEPFSMASAIKILIF